MGAFRKIAVAGLSLTAGLGLTAGVASADSGSGYSLHDCIEQAVEYGDVADSIEACVADYLASLEVDEGYTGTSSVTLGSASNGGINTAILGSADGEGAVNTGILGSAWT